jgi:peptidoglycan/xylan/chitin deacetylase (PgdA/CDA1 family)
MGLTTAIVAIVIASSVLVAESKFYVSLTFDDGYYSHLNASDTLLLYGMKGTFYVNSGRFGINRLDKGSMLHIQSQGHEVAGHTIDHLNLAGVNVTDDIRKHEICDDYNTLQKYGLNVTNFAYPFGGDFLGSPKMVYDCGYQSARDSGGLKQLDTCFGCQSALRLPVLDKYLYRIPSIVILVNMSFAELAGYVDAASAFTLYDDKWLIFVIHNIVKTQDDVDSIKNMLYPTFVQFLDALKSVVDYPSSNVFVKNIREVLELFPSSYVPTGTDTITPTTPEVGTSAPTSPPTAPPASSASTKMSIALALLLVALFATVLLL